MSKKLIALLLALVMVVALAACGQQAAPAAAPAAEPAASGSGLIKVGVVNNPPSESGYREANVNDFISVFTEDNGYEAKFFYSIKNDEQLSAARQLRRMPASACSSSTV